MSLFVAFEGIDACGKATQSKMLADALKAELYSFPNYDSPMGRLIKQHLHEKWDASPTDPNTTMDYNYIDAMVFQAVQVANRLEVAPQLAKFLELGISVVADRYAISGEVYGGVDGLDPAYMERLQAFLPQPNIYFLLDIPVDLSFQRRPDRGGDRYEENRAKLEDVALRYRTIFTQRMCSETKFIILDGTKNIDTIHNQVLDILRLFQ